MIDMYVYEVSEVVLYSDHYADFKVHWLSGDVFIKIKSADTLSDFAGSQVLYYQAILLCNSNFLPDRSVALVLSVCLSCPVHIH